MGWYNMDVMLKQDKGLKFRRNRVFAVILLVVIIFGVGFLFWSWQGQKERLDVAQEEGIEEEDFGNTADLPDVRETEELEQECYFIGRNLERYLAYMKNNPELSMSEVVRNVNSNLDRTRYVDVKDADLSYGVLAMVNKFNYLGGYEPDDLVRLGEGYSNSTAPMLRREVAEAFVKMADAARSEGLVLMNISGYRSYSLQEWLYNNYAAQDGYELADTYSSRPGTSSWTCDGY